MQKLLTIAFAILFASFTPLAIAKGGGRMSYGGGAHTSSHGGTYKGGQGSSHRGGSYKNSRTADSYGTHK